jgi:hypothetical protein
MRSFIYILFVFVFLSNSGCDDENASAGNLPENIKDFNQKTPGVFVILSCPKENTSYIKYFGYQNAFPLPDKDSIGWLDRDTCGNLEGISFGFYDSDWELEETFKSGTTVKKSNGRLTRNEFFIVPENEWVFVKLSARQSTI